MDDPLMMNIEDRREAYLLAMTCEEIRAHNARIKAAGNRPSAKALALEERCNLTEDPDILPGLPPAPHAEDAP